uniref:Macroglobulin domain-containing protein n=1 Tax=Fundulus heteroclitus TaxID=8078 RepID=A0A3Q2Q3U8_FUNHE
HLVLLICFILVLLSIAYLGTFMIKWNVMIAPNVLRVATEERIFIEIQDRMEQNNVNVRISVMNHPTKTTEYASTSVTLTKQKNFQAFGKIVIPTDRLVNDRNVKQYVTLQAQFPGHLLEKVVLVSFQSGYIFIQTDKPIYTPSIRYRVFAMWPDMKSPSDSSINLDIMVLYNMFHKYIVLKTYYNLKLVVHVCSFGNWKMMAKFHSNAAESFTAEFEVKEYVLPSFEVQLSPPPESPFFYVDSKELKITIKARYMFGKEVDGTAYVVFGVILGNEKKSFTSSLQRVTVSNGEVKLQKEHITDIYPDISQLLGNSIYVSVSVLTQSGKRQHR